MRFDNQIQQVAGSNPAVFQNIGATKHSGVESAVDYRFASGSAFAGLNLFANYTYTGALQDSGPSARLDLPFDSRRIDTLGARYSVGDWAFSLSSTNPSSQFSDNANTVVWLHPLTGEVLMARRWDQLDPGAKAVAVVYPLHTGALGGMAWETVVFINGLALGTLGISGIWLWWKRRRRAGTRQPP